MVWHSTVWLLGQNRSVWPLMNVKICKLSGILSIVWFQMLQVIHGSIIDCIERIIVNT